MATGGTRKLPARPKTPVFIAAQKHVRAKLEKKWVAAFITSPQYLSRHKSAEIVGDHAHHDSQLANGIRVKCKRGGGGEEDEERRDEVFNKVHNREGYFEKGGGTAAAVSISSCAHSMHRLLQALEKPYC